MIKRGFTIIELLIAVALTVVIGMMVSLAFTNTQKASQRVTSAMRLQLKGRAIMDLVARDLANMVVTTAGSQPTTTTASYDLVGDGDPLTNITTNNALVCKTSLPIQNIYYSNAFTAADGYYAQDIVDVGWLFNLADKKLYRKVTDPTGSGGASAQSVLTGAKFDISNTASGTYVGKDENLVTSGDIRNFRFSFEHKETSGNNSWDTGEILHGYTIDFTLTDAPVSETEILTKKTAEENGYVWLDFHRSVMVSPFAKP